MQKDVSRLTRMKISRRTALAGMSASLATISMPQSAARPMKRSG